MANTNQKIFFKKESDSFYKELKEEIENYFVEKNMNKYANNFMYFKMIFFFSNLSWKLFYNFLLSEHLLFNN